MNWIPQGHVYKECTNEFKAIHLNNIPSQKISYSNDGFNKDKYDSIINIEIKKTSNKKIKFPFH